MVYGVVAEFNPFHNGHRYQIEKIKKNSKSVAVAVISGSFVQRGEVSLLDKWEKTKLALEYGYDLVIELPVYYSIQNAEIFCNRATKILDKIGVDYQVFGVETEDSDNLIKELEEIIKLQDKEEYKLKIKKYLKEGNNYIKSHELTLKEYGKSELYKSNNILALEYLKTIHKNNLKIKAMAITRINTEYNSNQIVGEISSATNIRNIFFEKDFSKLKNIVPEETFKILEKTLNNKEYIQKLFMLFKYNFITSSKDDVLKTYDVNDSLYGLINNNIKSSENYYEFLEKVNNKNISINRIKRFILNFLLNIKKEDISLDEDIEYIRVLGINEIGSSYLKQIKDKINIYSNWKDIETKNNDKKIEIEKNSFLLSELILGRKEKLNLLFKEEK